jgi:hypothetical protein
MRLGNPGPGGGAKGMGFSWWNHHCSYEATVPGSPEEVYAYLRDYYAASLGAPEFVVEEPPRFLKLCRGSLLLSLLAGGSETRLRHWIQVGLSPGGTAGVQVAWFLTVNCFGFLVGKNALLGECEELVERLSEPL